jgi:hypothetical protein
MLKGWVGKPRMATLLASAWTAVSGRVKTGASSANHVAIPAVSVPQKTAGNSERTAGGSLLFRTSIGQKSRISAADEISVAVNFREEQRKQRKPILLGQARAGQTGSL